MTNASFGPVGVEEGFTPCEFTTKFEGEDVTGTYNPVMKRYPDGSFTAKIKVETGPFTGNWEVTTGNPGFRFHGLCGKPTKIH